MNTLDSIKERLEAEKKDSTLTPIREQAINDFNKLGIPTSRNEEWKYTRIGSLFNKDFHYSTGNATETITDKELDQYRLPGHEKAFELVFINGIFSDSLSKINSIPFEVMPLNKAMEKHGALVKQHLGNSSKYVKDGIHALNTAFVQEGLFIFIPEKTVVDKPIYLYNIIDNRNENLLSQPRVLIYVSKQSEVKFAETYVSLGVSESFSNQVVEVIVEKDAFVDYYKIQNDSVTTSHVCTSHFRQIGTSTIHAVTISLNGNIVRNNLNIALEAERAEAHLYGLYFLKGQTHIDNHTVVDHVMPNCMSNELYKGIIDNNGTAVFNGKIFVQQDAQKTNAFQSNKNVLLSETASVNTKPQLEIFADDVKCSHGCTVGQLDEEGMFYLRSRGINEKIAKSLLVHAFAIDILEHIKLEPLREYADQLISERLEFEIS
jgi:Fe-S cluster assembly protein SufD